MPKKTNVDAVFNFNDSQITTLKTALNFFYLDLSKNILGEDQKGKELKSLYLKGIREVQEILGVSPPKKVPIETKIAKIKIHKQIKSLPGIALEEDLDPDLLLAKAYEELNTVIIAGLDKEDKYYFASSVADGGDILWIVEKLKCKLMEQVL